MKTIIKSLLLITLVSVLAVKATGAYFTSSVTAADNEIQTGTLLLAVDTARTDISGSTFGTHAWNVVRENEDGTITLGNPFVTWEDAAPGETHPYYIALRNRGTIDMNVRFAQGAGSEWVAGPRFGTGSCPATPAAADPSLVSISNVHQYASGNCAGETGCENLYNSLTSLSGGWDHLNGLSVNDAGLDGGYYYANVGGSGLAAGTHLEMGEKEFALYRVDVILNGPATDNCYQGATYNFDLQADGKQPADTIW